MAYVTTTLVSGQNAFVGAVISPENYTVTVSSGIQGPPGANGIGIVSANVSTGNLVLTFSNSVSIDVGSIIGPQGPIGNTGPQGETGPQGIQGETGPQGPQPLDYRGWLWE